MQCTEMIGLSFLLLCCLHSTHEKTTFLVQEIHCLQFAEPFVITFSSFPASRKEFSKGCNFIWSNLKVSVSCVLKILTDHIEHLTGTTFLKTFFHWSSNTVQ